LAADFDAPRLFMFERGDRADGRDEYRRPLHPTQKLRAQASALGPGSLFALGLGFPLVHAPRFLLPVLARRTLRLSRAPQQHARQRPRLLFPALVN
jgi:hypothetical protein